MKTLSYLFLAILVLVFVACDKDEPQTTIETLSATDLTPYSVTCWGKIENGKNAAEYGIAVYLSGERILFPHTVNKTDSFGVKVTGIEAGQEHSYIAYYIRNDGSTVYAGNKYFKSPAQENYDAALKEITHHSLTFEISGGEYQNWSIYYSLSEIDIDNITADIPVVSSANAEITIDDLLPNTYYYVAIYATDHYQEKILFRVMSYKTDYAMPVLTSFGLSDVSTNGVKASFSIAETGGGDITGCGLKYSTNEISWSNIACTYSEGEIEGTIHALQPKTTYKIFAYARNAGKERTSDTLEFTTLGDIPVLKNTVAIAEASFKVNLNGGVENENFLTVTDYGFCWDTEPGNVEVTAGKYTRVTTGSCEEFSLDKYDLTPGITYYVRAYARNSVGYGYSDEVTVEVPAVSYGTLTDTRDGKAYKTVVIGNQTWMAEDLKYGGVGYYDHAKEKYRIPDNPATARPFDDVCPAGWRMPSKEDFEELIRTTVTTSPLRSDLLNNAGFNADRESGYWPDAAYNRSGIGTLIDYVRFNNTTGLTYTAELYFFSTIYHSVRCIKE